MMPRNGRSGNRTRPGGAGPQRQHTDRVGTRALHLGEDADVVRPFGQFSRQRPAAVPVGDDSVVDPRCQFHDGHLEHVSGTGSVYGDRSGDDMGAVRHRIAEHVAGDLHRVGEYVCFPHTVGAEIRDRVLPLVLEMPSWLSVSMVTVSPGRIRRTGVSVAHGSRPHRAVSAVVCR